MYKKPTLSIKHKIEIYILENSNQYVCYINNIMVSC